MNNHLLEVLNGKIMYENFNLSKPSPTPPPHLPPPSLPHMPAIAGAYPLRSWVGCTFVGGGLLFVGGLFVDAGVSFVGAVVPGRVSCSEC
jgi:hypothetical protein